MMPLNVIEGPQFDYIQKGNPTIDVNPRNLYATWLNIDSGELFICLSFKPGFNSWQGQNGTLVRRTIDPTANVLTSFACAEGLIGVAFDGTNIITSNTNSERINIHEGETGTISSYFSGYGGNIKCICPDGCGGILAADYTYGVVIHYKKSPLAHARLNDVDKDIMGLCIVDGNVVASSVKDSCLIFYDGFSNTISRTLTVDTYHNIHDLAFDGENLWGTEAHTLLKIDMVSGALLKEIDLTALGDVYGIGINASGRFLVASLSTYMVYTLKTEED